MDDTELAFNILVTGECPFEYDGDDYFIKLVSVDEKSKIKLDIHNLEKKLTKENLATSAELIKEAVKREMWGASKQKNLDELPKKIKKMQESIGENGEFFARKERKILEKLIEKGNEELTKLQERYDQITENSLESTIRLREFQLTLFFSIYNKEGRVFSDPADVNYDDRYTSFVSELNEVLKLFTETIIRKIARSNVWFTIYNSGKGLAENIWRKTATEISDEQLILLSWTRRYENIYKDPEAPDEHIINNDKLFDAWVKEREKEIRKNRTEKDIEKRVTSKNFTPKSPFDRREVFIMSDKESAEKIYELNNSGTRKRIQEEQKKIKEKGKISEARLRVFKS